MSTLQWLFSQSSTGTRKLGGLAGGSPLGRKWRPGAKLLRAMIRSAQPQAGQVSMSAPNTQQWQVYVRLQPLVRSR